ncbi:hypothetical protein ACEQUB_00673 [Ralstonia syzygii]|uniref:Trypsin-like peptidase domain-containing protein n=2 Tax=Ralstonia syzygii TaxID=28097 RepID=G3A569_9RALS|nr:hypothetical protein RALSY_30850 [Ralstonia syzygii R24]
MREVEPFDDISKHIKGYELTASTHCEPIYLMRNRSGEKHDEGTDSATITYVKFNEKYYALTCAHVADAREGGLEGGPSLVPTVWGPSGHGFAFRAGSENALAGEFRFLERPRNGHRRPDIAIAPLSEDFIRLHMQAKGKVPLDLDKWEELDWSLVRTCATWGFPNRQKFSSGAVINAKLLTTILALQSQPMSFDRDEFLLASSLPESVGISFSGLSGSAIYCLQSDGCMTPVGIIYEGMPGDPSSKKADGRFYGPSDFQIQAFVLSQTKFRGWLEMLGLTLPR